MRFIFVCTLEPKTPPSSPIRIHESSFTVFEDKAEDTITGAIATEAGDEKSDESKKPTEKLIQKEAVETGSVSSMNINSFPI